MFDHDGGLTTVPKSLLVAPNVDLEMRLFVRERLRRQKKRTPEVSRHYPEMIAAGRIPRFTISRVILSMSLRLFNIWRKQQLARLQLRVS